ncbi:phosphatase PAP2 family protein [Noviherbaspirillum sp.]|uniref:phosphatase PAP2 family protein n=1 Tax=Noviherbaspirillum sp. TaxID=1926288 RepID=UPI002FE37F73
MLSLPASIFVPLPIKSTPKIAVTCGIALLGMVDLIWAHYIDLAFHGLSSILGSMLLLALIGVFYDLSGRSKRLSDMGYYAALWTGFSATAVIFTYLTASLNFPLHDALFADLDAKMGFDWVALYLAVEGYPRFSALLGWAYDSMYVQLFVSMLYFAHKQWTRKNDELLLIAFISLVVTSIFSGVFPAVCAWHYFDLGIERSVHLSHLLSLRNGTAASFSIDQMQGIVTLPSYHTVIALLLIYVYRDQKWSFLLILALNVLMLLSVPFRGGHYLVDMIAAGILFVLSAVVTKYVLRSRERATVPDPAGTRPLMAPVVSGMRRPAS